MGMVGGGCGVFIGVVYRMVVILDGEIELVCGVFSSDLEKFKVFGVDFYFFFDWVYGSFGEMILKEKVLFEGKCMDFVFIVIFNYVYFLLVKMALENGFFVVCDKFFFFNIDEVFEL